MRRSVINKSRHLAWSLLLLSLPALAAPPSEGDFRAARTLGDNIARWMLSLTLEKGDNVMPPLGEEVAKDWKDPRFNINSISVVAVEEHDPVDPALGNVIETEMMESIRKVGIPKVSTCYECRTPAVYVQDNELVVSKGITDVDSIKRVAKRLNTDVLLVSEIFRTKYTIIAQVAAYNLKSGELIGAEKFTADSLISRDDTVQLMFLFGTGAPLIVNDNSGSAADGTFTGSGNIQLTEELGFAKGGLNLGMVLAKGNTLIHLAPTLAFRGNIGNSTMKWMFSLGAGYGIQSSLRGIIGRASIDLILGNWAVLGGDTTFFFPNGTTSTDTYINGYFGFHIGFNIGR